MIKYYRVDIIQILGKLSDFFGENHNLCEENATKRLQFGISAGRMCKKNFCKIIKIVDS